VRNKAGFSLVELLIVIAVVVILIALLLPAVGMVRANARQGQCASNQRQVFAAWQRASSRTPVRGAQWPQRISHYIEGGSDVLNCPDDTDRSAASSYALNDYAWRFLAQDSGRIVLLDYKQVEISVVGKTVAQLDATWPAQQAPRHFGKLNVAFGDGHVDSREPQKIDPRFCDYYVRYWRPVADSNIPLLGCASSSDPLPALPGTTTVAAGTGSTAGTTTVSSATAGGTSTGTSTTGATTTGGTSAGGTTTGGTTGSDPCYTPNYGFTEVAQFSLDFYDSNDSFAYNRLLDPNDDPLMMMTQNQTNSYEIWMEAVDGANADWDDLNIRFTRLPNGDIEIYIPRANQAWTADVLDASGNVIPGLVRIAENSTLHSAFRQTFPGARVIVPGQANAAACAPITGMLPLPSGVAGRYVKVTAAKDGDDEYLNIGELYVFDAATRDNAARSGTALQSTTFSSGAASKAIDNVAMPKWSWGHMAHTSNTTPGGDWLRVDLGSTKTIYQIRIQNRWFLEPASVSARLSGAKIEVLDASQVPVWSTTLGDTTGVGIVVIDVE